MERTSCPLCDRPAVPGQRYCQECGGAGQLDAPSGGGPAPAASPRPADPPGGRGELRLFFGVFLFVGLTTTLLGMAAPAALNHPAIRKTLHLEPLSQGAGLEWGELRWVHTGTRVREGRSTRTATLALLQPGDSVRADFGRDGWYAVFSPGEEIRDESQALGYVYAPLLKPEPPPTALARP